MHRARFGVTLEIIKVFSEIMYILSLELNVECLNSTIFRDNRKALGRRTIVSGRCSSR